MEGSLSRGFTQGWEGVQAQEGPIKTSFYCEQLAGEAVRGHSGDAGIWEQMTTSHDSGQAYLKPKHISCLGNIAILQCFHTPLFNPSFSGLTAGENEAGRCVFSKITNLW